MKKPRAEWKKCGKSSGFKVKTIQIVAGIFRDPKNSRECGAKKHSDEEVCGQRITVPRDR
jgi:hypothetical protein